MNAAHSRQELVRDAFQWDVSNWSQALRLWDTYLVSTAPLNCLELGSIAGGLSLYAAMHGHTVVCSDLTNPRDKARPLHQHYGVSERINYQSIDALHIPYTEAFDVVMFKSILGGIGRNKHPERIVEALIQMHRALKPGGVLLFAENLAATRLHGIMRKRFSTWGGAWYYSTAKELESGLAPFSMVQTGTAGFCALAGRSEPQRNSLSWLDRNLFVPLLPRSMHYLIYGVAVK